MAEVVAYVHEGHELVYDTCDVESVSTPSDIITTDGAPGFAHHELGQAHLTLIFKPGRRALWRKASGSDAATVRASARILRARMDRKGKHHFLGDVIVRSLEKWADAEARDPRPV